MDTVKLGRTDLQVSRIGVGTAAWGFKLMGYGKTYTKDDLFAAYQVSLDNGVNLFDTADSYADGDSERLIGEFHEKDGRKIVIATKHNPRKDRQPEQIIDAIKGSIERLRVSSIDLYQLHYPPQDDRLAYYADVLAGAYADGLIKAVGVSNFNLERTARFYEYLKKYHIPLASNQVYYNLLERRIEKSGLLDYCEEHHIAIIPLSPMAQGVLTGKYNMNKKLSFTQKAYFWIQQLDLFHEEKSGTSLLRRMFTMPKPVRLQKYRPLFQLMEQIAKRHQMTVGQVALRWLLSSGEQIIPIPGAKNKAQAESNSKLLTEKLSDDKFQALTHMEERLTK